MSNTITPSPALSSVPSSEDLHLMEEEVHLSSSSDSGSNSNSDYVVSPPPTISMSSSNNASVIANPKAVPVLTAGKIRPETLID